MSNSNENLPEEEVGKVASDGLKQRLVGAVVLVSIAVIFLPMLFDQPHKDKKNISIPIPDREPEKIVTFSTPKAPDLRKDPNTKTLEILKDDVPAEKYAPSIVEKNVASYQPSKSQEVVPASGANEMALDEEVEIERRPVADKVVEKVSTPKNDAPDSSKATEEVMPSGLDGAWVVQMGTFSSETNALRLRDNARAQGYNTHTSTLNRGGKTLTRVFSGPFVEKSDAEKVKAVMDRKFKVNSLIVKFKE